MKKPKEASLPPISRGGIYLEELPFPYVHYPSHYGAFIAFARRENDVPYLCDCSKPAIENYFELSIQVVGDTQDYQYEVWNHFDQLQLPKSILQIVRNKDLPFSALEFARALCHRCNLNPPSLRFCHELYGAQFIQYYGWYIEQAYLRFGILTRNPGAIHHSASYLESVTPPEFIADIENIIESRNVLENAWIWFDKNVGLMHQKTRDNRAEIHFDPVEITKRQDILRSAQRNNRRAERVLSKKIENIVREEFGHKKVGERWTSETLLYQIVSRLFPNSELFRHHRPEWLGGLELDIFIPEFNLGIEYQGQEHFHPIEAWGGKKALKELQERDNRKVQICQDIGAILVTIDYTEPLTMEYVRMIIDPRLK